VLYLGEQQRTDRDGEAVLYLGEQQRTDRDGDTGNWCLKLALQQKTTDDSVSTHE